MSRERARDKEAFASEKEVAALRAINGAANWLAGQTRPDLCVSNLSQSAVFPATQSERPSVCQPVGPPCQAVQ